MRASPDAPTVSPRRPAPHGRVGAARRVLAGAALVLGVAVGTTGAYGAAAAAIGAAPRVDLDSQDTAALETDISAATFTRGATAPSRATPRAAGAEPQASITGAEDIGPIDRSLLPVIAPATADDQAALAAAVAAAVDRVASTRGVLADPALADAVDVEVAAAQSLLAGWDAPDAALTQARVASQIGALDAATAGLPLIEVVDGATRINGVLVVNKTFPLAPEFGPGLDPELLAAFDEMAAAAKAQGIYLWIGSGFRSYVDQQIIYGGYESRLGVERADTFSARPGHSEHQSGLSLDLNEVHRGFSDTAAAAWVAENAPTYGFVIRYPEGKEESTGYAHESWHLRYLGVDLATQLSASGLSLEEYLGVTSVYPAG